jgi:hypothetical protein
VNSRRRLSFISFSKVMEARQLLQESIQEYQAVDDIEASSLISTAWDTSGRQTGEAKPAAGEVIARKIDANYATGFVLNRP